MREIKRLLADGNLLFHEIAAMFGVSRPLIGMISRGRRWAHVTLDLEGTHYSLMGEDEDDSWMG